MGLRQKHEEKLNASVDDRVNWSDPWSPMSAQDKALDDDYGLA